MDRHFTVTGFVSYRGATMLHWHRKLSMWLPPGGHIEPNEDPIEAIVREVREETGLDVEVLPSGIELAVPEPLQLTPPVTILVEDIPEPTNPHQHIDLIYFCRPIGSAESTSVDPDSGMRWVTAAELQTENVCLTRGDDVSAIVPEDVRLLALAAIASERAGRVVRGPQTNTS